METSTFQIHDFENEDTAEGEKVGWDESSKANTAKPIFRCIMTAESSRGIVWSIIVGTLRTIDHTNTPVLGVDQFDTKMSVFVENENALQS